MSSEQLADEKPDTENALNSTPKEEVEKNKQQEPEVKAPVNKLVVYKNGDFAYGELDDQNLRHGFVRYQSRRGPHVMGFFQQGQREGECRVDYTPSSVYAGGYHFDSKNGIGIYRMNNDTLIGSFKCGQLWGYGRYFAEKSYYEGFFSDSKFDGYGIEIMANSDCYIGEFKRGRKEGLGIYLFNKGGYYYGFFKGGEKHEMGVQYNPNYACYYLGQFSNDMRNGRGMQM